MTEKPEYTEPPIAKGPLRPIADLSLIRLTKDAGRFGEYPVGMIGVVVHVYPDGEAYEVELTYSGPAGRDAYSEVVTIDHDGLELA